jgi:hypothetical protein
MTLIEGYDRTTAFQRRSRYDQIVVADHSAGNFESGPNASVFQRRGFGMGNNRHVFYGGSHILLSLQSMRCTCSFYAMPQLGNGNGGDSTRSVE